MSLMSITDLSATLIARFRFSQNYDLLFERAFVKCVLLYALARSFALRLRYNAVDSI